MNKLVGVLKNQGILSSIMAKQFTLILNVEFTVNFFYYLINPFGAFSYNFNNCYFV